VCPALRRGTGSCVGLLEQRHQGAFSAVPLAGGQCRLPLPDAHHQPAEHPVGQAGPALQEVDSDQLVFPAGEGRDHGFPGSRGDGEEPLDHGHLADRPAEEHTASPGGRGEQQLEVAERDRREQGFHGSICSTRGEGRQAVPVGGAGTCSRIDTDRP